MIIYSKYNTKIIDGYKIKSIKEIVDYIIAERKRMEYPVTRTKASYISEWKAHNRLYRLGIKRSHTKDVDLNEYQKKGEDLIWRILGI